MSMSQRKGPDVAKSEAHRKALNRAPKRKSCEMLLFSGEAVHMRGRRRPPRKFLDFKAAPDLTVELSIPLPKT